jgi:serine/threonine-protein kinase
MSDQNPIQIGAEATLTRIRAAGARVGTGARTVFARLAHAARGRPWLAVAVAAAVLGGGLAAAVALTEPGDSVLLDLIRPQRPGLRELARRTREQPRSASAWKAYGKGLFDAGKRRAGVRAHGRALALDAGSADGGMVEDLLACFGHGEQGRAEALIVRYRLTRAAEGLGRLAQSKRQPVRWGAVRTLEKIGKGDRAVLVRAWMLDLDSPDCDVRRRAADRLGESGDRHALAKLRAVKKKEDRETPWYRSACLGDRAERAEKRILARR